jgi:hypothetical protein
LFGSIVLAGPLAIAGPATTEPAVAAAKEALHKCFGSGINS